MKYPYLQDSLFLKEIDCLKIKNRYAKIILLDWDEKPQQAIDGVVVGGNINIDGSSSMRRTGSINIVSEDKENVFTDVRHPFSLNKKISIEIGVENTTDKYKEYDIIWMPQGIFVICGCSLTRDNSQLSISLQFKDKMCLLNGDCGGTLPASITFNEYETLNPDGTIVVYQPTIHTIIQELVNHWGGEQLGKIIISDLDERIHKIMKWAGQSELFVYCQNDGNEKTYFCTTDSSKIPDEVSQQWKFKYGEDIGFTYTDFVYTEDLVNNAGESITSVLDKIIQYLGNYEYFYDIDGNFIFQEKKNYLNVSQSTKELTKLTQDDYLLDMGSSKSCYSFNNSTIVTSYSNTPQYSMIKNDFIVWGQRKTIDGKSVPIRYHLSIDNKPEIGNTYSIFSYTDENEGTKKINAARVFEELPLTGKLGVFYQVGDSIYIWNDVEKIFKEIEVEKTTITANDWRTELFLDGATSERFGVDSNYYWIELENEWLKLYDLEQGEFKEDVLNNVSGIDYYLDFIDSSAAISEFSVSNIGRRTKVLNDDKINCIFEPDILNLVYLNTNDKSLEELRQECIDKQQDYLQADESIYSCIVGGGVLNSAFAAVRELLYQYTNYNETITLQTLPIYYLEPNTRITVNDLQTGIFGDYIINSISLPLDNGGLMSITANRVLERF